MQVHQELQARGLASIQVVLIQGRRIKTNTGQQKNIKTKYQMGKINGTENTKDKNETIKQKKTFKKLTTSEQQVPDS